MGTAQAAGEVAEPLNVMLAGKSIGQGGQARMIVTGT